MDRTQELAEVQEKIGVKFKDVQKLNQALTHPTYVFEHKEAGDHNQRLEFLGDAVLGMVMAEYLYLSFPEHPEGNLSKMRASMVCENALAGNAKKLNLGNYLLLGRGEELSGGRERTSILADSYEAVIGAIYLDRGLEQVRKFIITEFKPHSSEIYLKKYRDYKTTLQELVQKYHDRNVFYEILSESGPDHDKSFVAGVFFKDKLLAEGKGKSKKEAEQDAARKAYNEIADNVKDL